MRASATARTALEEEKEDEERDHTDQLHQKKNRTNTLIRKDCTMRRTLSCCDLDVPGDLTNTAIRADRIASLLDWLEEVMMAG